MYEVETEGELNRSQDETKQAGWYTVDEITALSERSEKYLRGEITNEEWQKSPGLEVFWHRWRLRDHLI